MKPKLYNWQGGDIYVYPGSEEISTAKSSQPDKDSENSKWVGVIILQGDMSKENKNQPMARIIVDDKSAKTVKVESPPQRF